MRFGASGTGTTTSACSGRRSSSRRSNSPIVGTRYLPDLNFRLSTAVRAAPSYAKGTLRVLSAGDSLLHPRHTPRAPLIDAHRRHTPAGKYGNAVLHGAHNVVPRIWHPMHLAG